jgi:predicted transcriptional regulator
MHTELGKLLKKLNAGEDITQNQLAAALGLSPAILSNYMTGKNAPEMGFVGKCIKRFKLEGEAVKDIFTETLSSTAKTHGKIVLDTRFFKPDRIEMLIQAIIVLLLYPDSVNLDPDLKLGRIDIMKGRIKNYFDYLDKELEYKSIQEPGG